jgi:hypothetical protein
MNIIYNGADITALCDVEASLVTEVDGGGADSLAVKLYRSSTWLDANVPQHEDEISLPEGNYTSGLMYVDTVSPDQTGTLIKARSFPARANDTKCDSYNMVTLRQLATKAAEEIGLSVSIIGIDGRAPYPRVLRRNEGWLSLLNRYAIGEGAALKCSNGKLNIVGYEWAQNRPAVESILINPGTPGIKVIDSVSRLRALQIYTAKGKAGAKDLLSPHGASKTLYDLPICNFEQAARWAKWHLFAHNRMALQIEIQRELNTRAEALQRVDLSGQYEGEWIIHRVTHDFKNRTTRMVLVECIDSILPSPL